MSQSLVTRPLTHSDFAAFGDVLDCSGSPDRMINAGLCERYHDRARLDFSGGRAGMSLFQAELRALPYSFDLVERHPDGSQAFVPMSEDPFLVLVAPDEGGSPGRPQAFLTAIGQAINFHRGTWHGVLTPLSGSGLFAVVDRIGDGANLEEYVYVRPWTVVQ